ncbi:molecular chaperone TorD family protein [Enterovibrio sp. ZSDZ35]|uniref:Molecular chaperone TorD family protein n=1 Tax=Enterovibrio qingdaonensis TaxID=2899818 RepID=A0ABT5QQR0_9GAMM|nr:molecular chaperone TorD family protein [Enterovibrio sp. ZSDZ35]MDD1782626.1 molecular chaperone TorD family protein [Enterovibrio sp. ZSDZ35]
MQYDSNLARLLGALLYHSPSSETASLIIGDFKHQNDELLRLLGESAEASHADFLEADFFSLLQGSGDMPCPPWGSAYLDNENALFGASTIEYRAFLSEVGLESNTGVREPEDHIGLMLMVLSVLLERDDVERVKILLSYHLLPFAFTMLEEMENSAQTDFYRNVALLTAGWLNTFSQEIGVVAAERRIYWETTRPA